VGAAALAAVPATAGAATIAAPSLDRWMYPFSATPGSRTTASTFGAIGEDGFDDRDAQFLVGFDTTSVAPAGLGAGNYAVGSVTVTAAVATGGVFAYDGTVDPRASYGAGGTDADAGRPVELFGVGYRNGFTRQTFAENSPFSPAGPGEAVRNAFAADYAAGSAVDVSNNVSGTATSAAFEATPWAVGRTALAAGEIVPANTTFTFELDMTDPDVLAYVQDGLNAGDLRFALTSLHEASLGGSPSFPNFYTRENLLASAAPASLTVTLVPEPSAVAAAAGLAGAALLRRRRC
jgi:hypothetical protein